MGQNLVSAASAAPTPPGTASCPASCTSCFAGNVCNIQRDAGKCNDTTITCPPEYACNIVCNGADACDTTVIECPPGQACDLACGGGNDACRDVELHCGDAPCSASCEADACSGMQMTCGA